MFKAPRDKALAEGRGQRLKAGLTNAALVIAALAVAYLVSEYVFFRHVLPHVTKDLRAYVPDRAEIYLQNAKAGYSPHDYVTLIGDSYAQGAGDWLWSVGYRNDRPYHSANVIRDLSGKDVITLGRGGAGSPEAIVLRVSRVLGEANCYIFPPLEPPRQFFIYFYEGNDIYDNSRAVKSALRAGGANLQAGLDWVLDHDYGAQGRCYAQLSEMMGAMASFLAVDTMRKVRQYVTQLLVKTAAAEHRAAPATPSGKSDKSPPAAAPSGANDKSPPAAAPPNSVLIAGAAVRAPELQIPPVNLTDRQLDDGVAVFDRSLAWFRRHFPNTPTTVVYIPSPAASYRHAGASVTAKDFTHHFLPDTNGSSATAQGPPFPVSQVYASSQRLCEKIRDASLKEGVSFVDLRPAFRQAGARQAIHGPTDWNHPNETGYRLLGAVVTKHLLDHPTDACDDSWPS
ncbi:MAG: SGNH/GDSL hydrolase family protein [Xanthobacteraceae bacterium]